jgi:hypothetical protein
MPERKPVKRLHRTVKGTLTLRLDRLLPGQEVRLLVIEPKRRSNRKRRSGRNRIVITRSEGIVLSVVDVDFGGKPGLIQSD